MQYANTRSEDAEELSRKSWVAYVAPLVLTIVLLVLIEPVVVVVFPQRWPGIALGGLIILWGAYQIALARSVVLYVDGVGVWVYSGILPWSKGVVGVKFRDIDEATYQRNLWSWISRSYRVRIAHRFTRTSEIVLTNMAHGQQAVMEINGRLQALIRDGKLNS